MSEETKIPLRVEYVDAEPRQIRYSHTVFGLICLHIEDGVATLDEKWDRLHDRDVADGFDRWISTGDVLRAVQRLPFIDAVEVGL